MHAATTQGGCKVSSFITVPIAVSSSHNPAHPDLVSMTGSTIIDQQSHD